MAYAFVSHDIFEQNDILTGLLPFFKPFLAESNGALFDAAKIARQAQTAYGWQITADAVGALIQRLAAKGWIQRVEGSTDPVAYVCKIDPASLGSDEAEEQAVEVLQSIGELFLRFVQKGIPTLFDVAHTDESLKEMLLWWLVEKRAFDRNSLLKASELGEELPKLVISPRKVTANKYSREEQYLSARFVQHLYREHAFYFEKLVRIAAVALVAEVALAIRNPSVKIKNAAVNVCFDAPFVMTYLGLSGPAHKGLAEYIINSLKGLVIRLSVLRHSCDEVRQNLQAMLANPPGRRFGPTALAIANGDVLETYAKSVAANTDLHIERAGFQIVDYDPNSYPNEHQYFFGDLIQEFANNLPWDAGAYGYSMDKELSKKRDALSIAYVVRKRHGKQSADFFKSSFVFVSHNSTLCRMARRFCIDQCNLSPGSVGPAVHQRDLSAILWLALGTEDKVEISRQDLLASCEVIVATSPDALEGARRRLKEIKPEHSDQIDVLLNLPRSTQLLLDLTLGSGVVATENDANRVFDELRRNVATDVRAEANLELAEQEEKFEAERKVSKRRLADLEEQRRIEKDSLQAELQSERQMLLRWMRQADNRIQFVRSAENWAVYVLLSGATVLAGIIAGSKLDSWKAGLLTFLAAGIPCVIAGVAYNRKGRIISEVWLKLLKKRLFYAHVRNNGREDLLRTFIIDLDRVDVNPRSDSLI